MPIVRRKDTTIEAIDITEELLNAVIPVFPLQNTVIGVRLLGTHTHQEWCCDECNYLCLLHKEAHLTVWTPVDLTLAEAYSEAATCLICNMYLAIPPDFPEWDVLRDRLCNGNYSSVEIYTDIAKRGPFHAFFSYKRLLPGSKEPELLGWDYSAKHIADERRDAWPDAIWVDSSTFEAEIKKRSE